MENTNVKMASEAQVALYKKMVGIKAKAMETQGIQVISDELLALMTSKDLSNEIGKLQTLVAIFPASDAQKELIKSLAERAGLPVPPNVDTMTSSNASETINRINAFLASRPALATAKQQERIKLYIEAGLITEPGKIDFKKLTKADASEICDSFEPVYRTWRDTHVTEKQVEYIQSLQQRLGDMVIPREELIVMTRETASQLIDQLDKEYKNRKEYASQQVSNYKDLTDRSKEFEDRMKLSIGEREFEEKIEMCNKLFVMLGQEPEGMDAVDYNTIDNILTSMVDMARIYVGEAAIVEGLGLHELADIVPQAQ